MADRRFTTANIAPFLYEPLLGRLLSSVRSCVTEWCPTSGLLLDCCCGPGGLLRFWQGHGRGQSTLLGLDADANMLAVAVKNAPEALLLQGDAAALPLADRSVDAACVCMALHTMPLAVSMAALQELHRVARRVIVADYCLAERNVSLLGFTIAHAMERLAGGEHYRAYRAFMHEGGVEGLLHRAELEPVQRATVLGGAVRIALIQHPICPVA